MPGEVTSPLFGFALVIAAGALNGSFALPMKRTVRWSWENTWLVYSVVGMVIANWAIALATVPRLFEVFGRAGAPTGCLMFACGLAWGSANLLFGIGIDRIGMSLTFPICIGMSTALGSLIPLAARPGAIRTPRGISIVAGVAVILLGVAACAWAGLAKDARAGKAAAGTARGRPWMGLAIVVLAGLLDPTLNIAFTFGDRLREAATALGAKEGSESNAIWTLALLGSFAVNAAYCSALLGRNKGWSRYLEKGTARNFALAGVMGLAWMFSISLYGLGASSLGRLGGSAGWALFYSAIILFSTLWGVAAGEWRDGKGRPFRILLAGLAILLAAIVILGYGNTLPESSGAA